MRFSIALSLFSLACLEVVATRGSAEPPPVTAKVVVRREDTRLRDQPDFESKPRAWPILPVALNVLEKRGDWLRTPWGWAEEREVIHEERAMSEFSAELLKSPTAFDFAVRGALRLDRNDVEGRDERFRRGDPTRRQMRRAFYARARVWHRLEKWDMAIDDYDAVIELAPEASCYSNRGKIWLFIGEVERAIRDFDAALNLCPWSTQAYTARAAAYQRQGKIESALADLEEAIRYEPNDSNVYIARAQLFVTLRDFERALQDCDKAISLGDDHRLYLNRAHIHVLKGELDKALSDLDTAIEREPQFVQAWIGLSSVFLMIHDWEKAGDAADEAIRLDPKQAAAYSNRSSAWGGKKQYAKVIEDATQAILLGVRKGSGVVKTLCHFDSAPLCSPGAPPSTICIQCRNRPRSTSRSAATVSAPSTAAALTAASHSSCGIRPPPPRTFRHRSNRRRASARLSICVHRRIGRPRPKSK